MFLTETKDFNAISFSIPVTQGFARRFFNFQNCGSIENERPWEQRVGDIDANPCASESLRPQLSHAQRFKSKSITVASEFSIEKQWFWKNSDFSPNFTSFSCMKNWHFYPKMKAHHINVCEWSRSELLCVGKSKASTFTRTRIQIKIYHHCF